MEGRRGMATQFNTESRYLAHGHLIHSRVATSGVVVELTFNISKQGTCSKTEEIRPGPLLAQFLSHEGQPHTCILGSADPTCRLESHLMKYVMM